MKCGYNIVWNSSHIWKDNRIKNVGFVCSRYRKFTNNIRYIDNLENIFQGQNIHNDHKNDCGKEVR